MKLLTIIGIAVLTFLTLVIWDCSNAESAYRNGVVKDKEYQPGYTTVSIINGVASTTFHGPSYTLVLQCDEEIGRLSTNQYTYDQYSIGDECKVEFRAGKIFNYNFHSVSR